MAYFGIIKPAAFLTGRNVVLSIVRACSTSSSIDTPLKYGKTQSMQDTFRYKVMYSVSMNYRERSSPVLLEEGQPAADETADTNELGEGICEKTSTISPTWPSIYHC